MARAECPRCGPDWREKHKQRFLVLRVHSKYGLVCLDRALSDSIPEGEAGFYA